MGDNKWAFGHLMNGCLIYAIDENTIKQNKKETFNRSVHTTTGL